MARGVQFTKDSAKRIASTVRSVEAAPTDLTTFRRRDRGGEGGVMGYSDFAFGFSISGAVVKVNSGKIRQGTRTPISVSSADKIIRADQSFIFVTYTYGSGLAVLGSPTIVEPVDTEEVHNHVLYLVTLTAGVASVESGNIKHLGDIWLPGSFA